MSSQTKPSQTSKTVEAIQAALDQSQPERLMVRRPGTTLKGTVENGNLLVRELTGMGLGAAAAAAMESTAPGQDGPTNAAAASARAVKSTRSRIKPKKSKAAKTKVKTKFKPK